VLSDGLRFEGKIANGQHAIMNKVRSWPPPLPYPPQHSHNPPGRTPTIIFNNVRSLFARAVIVSMFSPLSVNGENTTTTNNNDGRLRHVRAKQ